MFFLAAGFDVEWLDDGLFATCGSTRVIYVKRSGIINPVARLEGHWGDIHHLAYQPDSKLLASGADDRMACIWQMGDFNMSAEDDVTLGLDVRTPMHHLRGHQKKIMRLAWQPSSGQRKDQTVLITYVPFDLWFVRDADGVFVRQVVA